MHLCVHELDGHFASRKVQLYVCGNEEVIKAPNTDTSAFKNLVYQRNNGSSVGGKLY
jgi:hypothetical protein